MLNDEVIYIKWEKMSIIQALLDMGAVVVLPIIIFILGLIFRLRAKDAFKSGLTIGIGFMAGRSCNVFCNTSCALDF